MEEHQRALIAAQGYCELRMYDDALAELEALPREVHGHPVVVEMRLVTLMQARRWEAALEAAQALARLRPEATSGFIHAAFCLHELARTAEAKAFLLTGPAGLQKEANYYYNLACYECVLGRLEEARELLATAFKMDAKYREYAKTDPDLRGLKL